MSTQGQLLNYKSSRVMWGTEGRGITFSISLSSFLHIFGLQDERKGLMSGIVRIFIFKHMVDLIHTEPWYARSLPIQVVYAFTCAHISDLQLV